MENEVAYITKPKGFKAAGIHAGLKANGNRDLGLVVSDCPCVVSGVYTSNLVKGHSLVRTIDRINSGVKPRAVIVNTRIANSGVGKPGLEDAEVMAKAVAESLGITSDEVLTGSTGTIGVRLPIEKIVNAVPSLVSELSDSEESAHNAALAIMTTDTKPKEATATITLKDGKEVTISAIAKGSGMIHPNLATMISIFTTDASIDKALLDKLLKKAVSHTFNRVSVDGDTSVCDMVVIMANGMAEATIKEGSEDENLFGEALTSISNDIARMIAADGEGATKFVEIEVFGARNNDDAKLIVTSVARSPLVKTAIFGEDANIGRVLTAVGYSGAKFNPDKIDILINDMLFFHDGICVDFDEDEAGKLLAEHDIHVVIKLCEGEAYDRMYTCDFSYDYVKINGSYRT
ncbi:MAG: bifunctional glutamate N-acetyltransferase/amino-acid acetyltransferase ArgJ [Saccharofermentans sp.]|nr:bifunctional glutamate N-acetyltransferase/amino-acid acetyltransferase ArgJ [Saccharofermentans sp.]